MSYHGDILEGDTLDFHFTTVDGTGVPTTLSGTPVLSAYEDNSTTEITAGVSVSADFDGRTGFNHCRVVATTGNGFQAGSNYSVVITTGTVDGNSVVGYVVGSFSIEARYASDPSIAARTNASDLNTLLGVADTASNDLPAQVLDGDTMAELSQAAPSATPTLREAVMLPYMGARNETTASATLFEIKDDAGTVICKATLTKTGTQFTRAELVSGP